MLTRSFFAVVLSISLVALAAAATFWDEKAPSAEEWLKKVEKKYSEAKTVQWRAKITHTAPPERDLDLALTVRLKKENKFDLAWPMEGELHRITSDGENIGISFLNPGQPLALPKDVAAAHRVLLARSGCALFIGALRSGPTATELDQALTVRDPKITGQEQINGKQATVISFALDAAEGLEQLECTQRLWLDTQTVTVLKIETSYTAKKQVATEVRTETEFDKEIDPKHFEFADDSP